MKPKSKKAINELWQGAKMDLLYLTIVAIVVYFFLGSLYFNDLKDVLSSLQVISAAIFTIVGLWVGFLYPNSIQSIVNDNVDYIKNSKDAPRVEKLIYIIIISALVMLGTLVFFFLKSIFYKTFLFEDYKGLIKFCGFVFIYYLCWLQAKCIGGLIVSNLRFANNLHARFNDSRIKHD